MPDTSTARLMGSQGVLVKLRCSIPLPAAGNSELTEFVHKPSPACQEMGQKCIRSCLVVTTKSLR